MNRRRFLKYAGATVAVVGASALGLDYLAKYSPSSSLASVTSSATSSSKELVSLEGELFVGWDGNGIKEEGDLPLSNEKMVLVSNPSGGEFAETTSDSSGHWEMDGIPTGDYVLYGEAGLYCASEYSTCEPRFPEFRYMCQSNKDFRPVGGTALVGSYNIGSLLGYSLSLNESQKMDFEFSHGFLTLPFPKGTPIQINAYVDECAHTENSQSGQGCSCRGYFNQYCGMPGEPGIDFGMPIGTPVVAAAPGKVIDIWDMGPKGITLIISHEKFTRFEALKTAYACMSDVSDVFEGQEVYRGQRIGSSGEDKTSPGPHLHFELGRPDMQLDPFASLWNSEYKLGYWTKINDPQFSV